MDGLDSSGGSNQHNRDVEVFTPSPDLSTAVGRFRCSASAGARARRSAASTPTCSPCPPGGRWWRGLSPGTPGSSTRPVPPTACTWQDYPNTPTDRVWGTAVLMPGGPGGSTQVMQLGGSKPLTIAVDTTDIAVPTTEVFDEANPTAGWKATSSMQIGRGHHNTVLLPDGSMVTVGGGVGIRNGDQWQAVNPEQRQVDRWVRHGHLAPRCSSGRVPGLPFYRAAPPRRASCLRRRRGQWRHRYRDTAEIL